MKKILALFTVFTIHTNAFATSDANTNVFIPVQHVQSGEFFVQIAPLIGCYGLPRGPQLQQLVAPYMVNNLGCGTTSTENINALSCAVVESAVEADDFSTFKKITLNITACPDKTNPDFIKTIKKVVMLNFATKTNPRPELILNGARLSTLH